MPDREAGCEAERDPEYEPEYRPAGEPGHKAELGSVVEPDRDGHHESGDRPCRDFP
ncbi:hypothetical protein [Phytohabitans suffuscus]|uniref:Uncharacterized protein n=1 Tax=Phytohabitans suffuscus TaxID=624315 RepID=A0A6F8YS77_9ACTN|nr:hypothetical protein Psuf_061560 [Phytohabitans suffuscus]